MKLNIKRLISLILLFVLIVLPVVNTYGQNNNKSTDYIIAQTHIENALEMKDTDAELSFMELDSALKFAEDLNDDELLADAYYAKAKVYDACQKYDTSVIYYELAAPYFLRAKDSLQAAKCYINIGATQYFYGSYDDALKTYDNASKYLKGLGESDLESKVYHNLALINKSLGKYEIAIENFQKVLEIHENNKNDVGEANAYINIGTIYWEHKNYHNALNSFNNALDIYIYENLSNDVANVYNNIGLVYSDLDSLNLALEYFDKALLLYDTEHFKIEIGTSLLNKAVLLDKQEVKNESEKLFREALSLFEQMNYPLGIYVCKLNLSRFFSEREQHLEATEIILEAFKLKKIDIPLKYLSDGYIILADSYSAINKFEDANTYYRKYFNLQDSIFDIEMNNQISELQAKYEFEKAETKLALSEQTVKIQNLEIEKKEKRIKSTSIILLLSLLFSLIFIFLYIQKQRTYRDLVKQNVMIAKSDIEKEKQLFNESTNNQDSNTSNSILTDNQKDEFLEKLVRLMDTEKFFMQKQITINDIAKKLKTNRNYLSQLINDCFHTNFNNFINEYRVIEARKLLLMEKYNNYTIEGIGETVGFHSKATFNTSFKKITGVTPSFFRNNSKRI